MSPLELRFREKDAQGNDVIHRIVKDNDKELVEERIIEPADNSRSLTTAKTKKNLHSKQVNPFAGESRPTTKKRKSEYVKS